MAKNKLNKIKLNIIAAILTLICISCAVNPIGSKVNSRTDIKENTENFENESGDLEPLKQKSQEETTISKLKALGKKMEAQKNEENAEIAKLTGVNLIDNLGIYPMYYGKNKKDEKAEEPEKDSETKFTVVSEEIQKNEKLQIERMIYSSLNYETDKINKLKEILETLKGKDEHENIAISLLYTTLDIQEQLDDYLELIKQDNLNTLSEKELQELLINVEFDLTLKEKFKKTLAKTVNEVSKTIQEIKDYYLEQKIRGLLDNSKITEIEDAVKKDYIISHITENYQIFNHSTQSIEFKQNKLNELKAII
ncbi:hypothetical protein Bmayo_04545 (plasmid) [Borreliella mayonii]|uniref:Uncharacterized protein n=1 Tax=Borreliella mayonii TaxID=1674146 RepID=A0AAC9PJX7_9SPIR|nr:complement regulator-acquiring protein [Borreliella mayonii]APS99360.1 hypothetical protein A7X70_06250 [Borreliella mayonii]APT00494.1 hypothetical protein Bmayo_04545 [Borreliella mayonii]